MINKSILEAIDEGVQTCRDDVSIDRHRRPYFPIGVVLKLDHNASCRTCGRLGIENTNFVVHKLQIFNVRMIGQKGSLQGHRQSVDGAISIAHLQPINIRIIRCFVHVNRSYFDRGSGGCRFRVLMGRYIAIGVKDAACAVKVGVRDCM